jgi:catechol 2,3-dioxygenase-like lactoylglutathione lyase family enzyme
MTEAAQWIQRIQHVALPFPGDLRSVEVARRFYGELLALEERPVPPGLPVVILWFAAGDQELHLFGEPEGVAANPQSWRHPCFQVADVAALRAHLDAGGATTHDDNGEIPGRPRFFALDPFGNTLEFITFEPDHW